MNIFWLLLVAYVVLWIARASYAFGYDRCRLEAAAARGITPEQDRSIAEIIRNLIKRNAPHMGEYGVDGLTGITVSEILQVLRVKNT